MEAEEVQVYIVNKGGLKVLRVSSSLKYTETFSQWDGESLGNRRKWV